jgi:hypothetical protein
MGLLHLWCGASWKILQPFVSIFSLLRKNSQNKKVMSKSLPNQLSKSPAVASGNGSELTLTQLVEELRLRATELSKYRQEIKEAEALLADLKKKEEFVSEKALPELMLQAGLEQFVMADGTNVSLQRQYFASVSSEDKRSFFEWLRENDLTGMIQVEFKSAISKGDEAKIQLVENILTRTGMDRVFGKKESVHPSTLRAWAKERMENAEPIPPGLNIHVKETINIK